MLLENWVERQEPVDDPRGWLAAGVPGAGSAQAVCVAVLRWPGRLGTAGTLSSWTAVICADAEGLPWQPDWLLLPLPSQSQAEL